MRDREASSATVVLHPAGDLLTFGPYRFDRTNRILSKENLELPLPPRVLGVLEYLVTRPGRVVSKQALMDAVWKDAVVTETSLTEAVSQLRQALAEDPQQPAFVQTVHRRGYRFVASVTVGALQAIRLLVGLPLNERLQLFDAQTLEWKSLAFRKDPACRICNRSS